MARDREAVLLYGASVAEQDDLVRLYGPWQVRTPHDALELLTDYTGPWWIAGGWAIEAFTGIPRPHGDLDLSIPRADVAALHAHLTGRFDLWQADNGTLRPMVQPDEELPDSCGNLWLRPSGADPWEYDVILMSSDSAVWTYKRDPRVQLPAADILWTCEGVTYLRPEVQLLHKAPGLRAKDQADFDSCRRLLPADRRDWLRTALAIAHPGHAWLGSL